MLELMLFVLSKHKTNTTPDGSKGANHGRGGDTLRGLLILYKFYLISSDHQVNLSFFIVFESKNRIALMFLSIEFSHLLLRRLFAVAVGNVSGNLLCILAGKKALHRESIAVNRVAVVDFAGIDP